MPYKWTEDLYDLADEGDVAALGMDRERVANLFYHAGEVIAGEDGDGYDACEAAADIIHLWYVPSHSALACYLISWHELHGSTLEERARDYVDAHTGFCFVTGCGYDWASRDLLGYYHGEQDTRERFAEYVEALEQTGGNDSTLWRLELDDREKGIVARLARVEGLEALDPAERTGRAVVRFTADAGESFAVAQEPGRPWVVVE